MWRAFWPVYLVPQQQAVGETELENLPPPFLGGRKKRPHGPHRPSGGHRGALDGTQMRAGAVPKEPPRSFRFGDDPRARLC